MLASKTKNPTTNVIIYIKITIFNQNIVNTFS